MSAEEGKQAYESWAKDEGKNPEHKETWTEWVKSGYAVRYESWMPWIEDQYLRWFTKDNKASYAAKDSLDKSKVTGIEQVDTLQDGVNNLAAGQVGKGGLLQPLGDMASTEGINRAERGGKDDKGGYAPGPAGKVVDPIAGNAQAGGEALAGGAQKGGQGVMDAGKSAGGYVGSLWGGKKEESAEKK